MILITHSGVTVNGVFRMLATPDLPLDIAEVEYNPQTRTGKVYFEQTPPQTIGQQIFEQLYQRYVQAWRAMGTPPERTLEMVKLDRRAQINSLRDNFEQAGFPYMDKVIDSNPVSVQRITVAVQAAQAALGAGQSFSIDWTTQDNSTLPLDAISMMGMPVALAIFAKDLHAIARIKKDLIDAAETIEAVEAVTWD